ncbi:nitroreductase family protein [Asticcacaulis sp. EMRT-3]|uniref:nitroreductase family protein n=1 Tax=Asticcacaulis sp. EMRT-3 TaxID=3040349 RepID=UPI0024AED732|nr:nitroreductase family protein [Asticcacaulis sp. EMRT-3]MDI7775973.1 nitroreductase family protein [Asticcacaulis sp. EMRT-3]
MTQPLRHSDLPVQPQFLERWSPRAFLDKPVSERELLTVLEAARFAPSASNLQPWRFIYGLKGEPEFATLLSLLVPFNEGWAKDAAALVFLTSITSFDGERPVPTGSFDTGAAWMSLALQAHSQGLITHGMYGIDFEKAPLVLGLPDNVRIEAAVAIGYRGDPQSLPEGLRERELPSDRQPLSSLVFKGHYGG